MTNTLSIHRKAKNLTQRELAKVLNIAGQTVHVIELNRYVPSVLLAVYNICTAPYCKFVFQNKIIVGTDIYH